VDLEIDGIPWRADVRPLPERWQVVVDGRQLEARVTRIGDRWSVLVGAPGARSHRSCELVLEDRDGRLVAHLDGRAVSVSPALPPSRDDAGRATRGGGAQRVSAPMPGRVVKVLVKPGDRVAAGAPLVVVEAMKMENEVRAGAAGVVTEVLVAEGAPVEVRTVLVVVS
jgi:biotin carboxyl carrier protein